MSGALGWVIIASVILLSVFIPIGLQYIFVNKMKRESKVLFLISILVVPIIVGFTIIPYGYNYHDPVGAGLTVMFGIFLISISLIAGIFSRLLYMRRKYDKTK